MSIPEAATSTKTRTAEISNGTPYPGCAACRRDTATGMDSTSTTTSGDVAHLRRRHTAHVKVPSATAPSRAMAAPSRAEPES